MINLQYTLGYKSTFIRFHGNYQIFVGKTQLEMWKYVLVLTLLLILFRKYVQILVLWRMIIVVISTSGPYRNWSNYCAKNGVVHNLFLQNQTLKFDNLWTNLIENHICILISLYANNKETKNPKTGPSAPPESNRI